MAYAGENQMIVEDALNRIDGLLERKPLPETEEPEICLLYTSRCV